MREYELVYILTPEIAEDAVPEAMDRVNRVIAGRGANVTQSERWGRRRLAYPIKRFLEGTYVVNQLQMTPERAVEVDSGLKLTEEVLRYLLVRRD
jgi:small subunit ribosomal protein S6